MKLEDITIKIGEKWKTDKKSLNNRKEQRINDLWDDFKWPNIHIIRVPKGEEREGWNINIFEGLTGENYSN